MSRRRKPKAPPGTFWRGSVLWARFEVAGREFRFSLRTADADVAVARLNERRQREIAAAHFGDQRRTWEEAVVAWGAQITKRVGVETAKRYAVSLGQLEPYLLGLHLDEIDKKVVSEIVRKRVAGGSGRKAVTIATVRRDLSAMSSVLEFCIEEDWVSANPALDRMKRLRERRDPIVLPEPEHIRAVIRRAPGNLSKLIEVAWLTGCRLDELVQAERRHLDTERRQLTVVGKGRKLRVIDLTPAAWAVFASIPASLKTRRIFWHSEGRPYANASSRIAGLIKQVSARGSAHPEPFRFHDLRHRFAVDFLKSGRALYDLQRYLGHSSVKTTEIYLAYLTPEEQVRAMHGSAQNAEHQWRFEGL